MIISTVNITATKEADFTYVYARIITLFTH